MSRFSIIVAVSENGIIGKDNDLPWKLSADLQRFKKLTMGHPIIMGRKTWESIGFPLPGRTSIVVSRNPEYQLDGAITVESLPDAITTGKSEDSEELFAIGGYTIFEEALSLADRLYLTRVQAEVDGDVTFPNVDWSNWKLTEEETFEADEKNDHPFSFQIYDRVSS